MRRFGLLLLLGSMLLLFVAFQSTGKGNVTSKPKEADKKILVGAVSKGSVDLKAMTKLNKFSYDLDLDHAEEKIELYTLAGRNEKGEMMWDDGQKWLLVIWDGAKAYRLLSEYVQLGSVYFTVSSNGVGKIPNINVITQTGTSFNVKTYSYHKDRGGFVVESVYNLKDTNFIYSSIPSY